MGASDVFDAIQRGDLEGLQQVLSRDPASAAKRNADGHSALVVARYARRMDMVRMLLEVHPPLDVFEAAMLGEIDRLRELLYESPDLASAWSADGFSALHLAASFGTPAAIEALLAAGSDPRAVSRNAMRLTPLHGAVTAGRHDIAKQLLDHGADPGTPQAGGFTPLHAAARRGDLELVDLLIAHGADATRKSDDGRDAAAFAAENGHEALAERLRRRSAMPLHRDPE